MCEVGLCLFFNKESFGGEFLLLEILFGDIILLNFFLIYILKKIKKNYVGVFFVD